MERHREMWLAVEKEHGVLTQREAYVALTAMEWADKTMIDKFLYWLTMKSPFIDNKDMDKAIVELRKYMEE